MTNQADDNDEDIYDETFDLIAVLCVEGDKWSAAGNYAKALDVYWDAFDLLPPPPNQWEAATTVLIAIGNTNFKLDDFIAGRDNLTAAIRCPGGLENPFLHLRLGQCQYELGNLDRAADELTRAYMGGGKAIFDSENPKYFAFLATRILMPDGG